MSKTTLKTISIVMILAFAFLMVHRTTHANTAVEFHSHEENDSITKIGFPIRSCGRYYTFREVVNADR